MHEVRAYVRIHSSNPINVLIIKMSYAHNYSYPEVPSSVPIWLDDLECSPQDTNLRLCPHAGTGLSDCQHSEDVIISCVRSKL